MATETRVAVPSISFPKPWPEAREGKKNVLIVISHPNTGKSFNHKLVEAAKATLEADGHAVIVDDLVKIGFNPISGRHDFTSLKNPDSFDLQTEQVHTVESGGKFAADLQEQLELVDWCDIVIHQFPIYWWSVPAIHKGWIDRCLVYHRAYPPQYSKWTGKQWMMSVTVGPDTEKATHPLPGFIGGQPYQTMLCHVAMSAPAMCAMEPVPMWMCGHAAQGVAEKVEMVAEYVEHIRKFVCGSKEDWHTKTLEPKWSASIDMMKTMRDAESPTRPSDHLGIIAPQPASETISQSHEAPTSLAQEIKLQEAMPASDLRREGGDVDTMKAFGIRVGGGVEVLEELEVPMPELRPRDLLVRVEAVALNPVDLKIRGREAPPGGFPKILGWDGAGVVETCGPEVTGYRAGDRIYFAGSVVRNGSNADVVAIDERIVARAPASIPAAVAASVPLVTLTAWEGLEQLGLDPSQAGSGRQRRLLVIPGAGGVGSYVIQLAKACGLQVIATASREESRQASINLGADFVINHREALKPQLEKLGIKDVHFIYDAVDFTGYQQQFSEIIQPFGKIVSITTTGGKVEILDALIKKSVAVITEFMFTRSMFEAEDMGHQGEILTMAAQMIDDKRLQTPIWKSLPWSLESLRTAHDLQQSGKAIGKIVMARQSESLPTVNGKIAMARDLVAQQPANGGA